MSVGHARTFPTFIIKRVWLGDLLQMPRKTCGMFALKDTERSKHQFKPASEDAHLGLSLHASSGLCQDRNDPDSSENDGYLHLNILCLPRSDIKMLD
jgi:hypothetical protein